MTCCSKHKTTKCSIKKVLTKTVGKQKKLTIHTFNNMLYNSFYSSTNKMDLLKLQLLKGWKWNKTQYSIQTWPSEPKVERFICCNILPTIALLCFPALPLHTGRVFDYQKQNRPLRVIAFIILNQIARALYTVGSLFVLFYNLAKLSILFGTYQRKICKLFTFSLAIRCSLFYKTI